MIVPVRYARDPARYQDAALFPGEHRDEGCVNTVILLRI
jgi:hypothetical protein